MDSIDRQALADAGLDPDDPREWDIQRAVSELIQWCAHWQPSAGG